MNRSVQIFIAMCCSLGMANAQIPEDQVTVQFDIGSHSITGKSDSILLEWISSADIERVDRFEIVAHTDAIGNLDYNEALSKRRAESIRGWMMRHSIDGDLCLMKWKGEIDSLVSNTTLEHRKLNRRATISTFLNKRYRMVVGSVRDSNNVGIDANIVIHGSEFLDSTRTDSLGDFSLLAPDSAVLGVDVFAKGFVYMSRMFKNSVGHSIDLNFKPTPIQRGVKFQLHRFYFVGNEAILLKGSESELVRLMRFMTLNPTTIIAIEGHINYPNNPKVEAGSTHFDLSERRAKMVYDYLLEKSISRKRMSFEGFGNWNMVYPKARSEELQLKNRRVEIRIVDQ